jgi:MFS family permease
MGVPMARAEPQSGEPSALITGAPTQPLPVARRGRAAPAREREVATQPLPAAARSRLGFRTVLRNRHFLRLWLAQLISQTIMNAANYGMIILIATKSGSVTATGGAIAAFSVPAALFGAPAGVLVDRLDKRRVLWASNVLRALASFGFVVVLFAEGISLVPVYFLIFFIALVGQFFAPAEGAAIPLLVHEDELVNALALFNITFTLSQALGLIVLGPLILATLAPYALGTFFGTALTLSSLQSLFAIVGVLYLVCALLVATIPHRLLANRARGPHGRVRPRDGERLLGIWHGIAECWRFTRGNRILFAAVLQLSLGGMVISIIAEIAPRFVQEYFGVPVRYAALVFMPAGAGLILGSLLVPHVIKRLSRRSSAPIVAGVAVVVGCALLITLVHAVFVRVAPALWSRAPAYFAAVLLLTFFIGIGLDLINIPAQTTMQELSPDWIKGRVLALQMMLFNAVTVPAVFGVGLAADYLGGLAPALNVLAVIVLVSGTATILYSRRARRRPLVVSRPLAGRTPGLTEVTRAGLPAPGDGPNRAARRRPADARE